MDMRILYFSPRNLWPPITGSHLRDYYLTRQLARRGLVSFFGLGEADQDENDIPSDLRNVLTLEHFIVVRKAPSYTVGKVLRGLVGPTPISVANYYDERIAYELRKFLGRQMFDLVQLGGIHLADYLPVIRSYCANAVVVCDWHNVESELMSRYSRYTRNPAKRVYAMRTARLLRNRERILLTQCDANIVVSENDLVRLRQMVPQAHVHLVENGVDMAKYHDAGAVRVDQNCIVFVGSMDYHANIDAARYFALRVWPTIRARHPELRFLIVGANPAPEVRALSNCATGIKVTGTVEDVQPYYSRAFVAVVPLRIGGGTRLKILEAMAAGVPVVTTRLGAEGLRVQPGLNIILADTPEEMIGALLEVYASPEKRLLLALAGRKLVEERYDWSVIGNSLHRIYSNLLENPDER